MYAYHQLTAKYDVIEYVMDEPFGRISGWTWLDRGGGGVQSYMAA